MAKTTETVTTINIYFSGRLPEGTSEAALRRRLRSLLGEFGIDENAHPLISVDESEV